MAYGQSKLANILHAKELSRRLKVLFCPRSILLYFNLSRRIETWSENQLFIMAYTLLWAEGATGKQ
jgi:hypothetical protein